MGCGRGHDERGAAGVQAIAACFQITGNVDVPGGIIAPPEILNYAGGWGRELCPEETWKKRIGLDKYPLLNFGFQIAQPDELRHAMATGKPYKIHATWLQQNNVLSCMGADPTEQYIGLMNCDFNVSVDLFMTPTSMALADYFLPACTYAERNGLRVGDGAGIDALKLVYTPLNGTGLECVKKLLKKLGVTHVTVVPEQEKPDGDFPTCPYPNPEIREAMQKGLELCDKVRPDLLLGTDPDCDRCGTAVPDGKGGYRLITGNEMGIILLDYICRTRLAQGTMPADPVAVTTIVSTDMAAPVAKKYGVELRRTLTGFKFIGEQIGKLEAEGRPERYIFGFEESYGYLSGGHVRDKDAVNATLLVCEAAAWYAQQGKTLLDAIEALYREFGYYRNALCSFAFEGESGMHTMQELMKKLRANAPEDIAGYKVESVVDYDTDGTGLPRANVLEYHLDGGQKLMVRPSGTEPKIKVYLSAVGDSEAAADAVNAALAKAAADMMKA